MEKIWTTLDRSNLVYELYGDKRQVVAEVYSSGESSKYENARLAASAPELLRLVRELVTSDELLNPELSIKATGAVIDSEKLIGWIETGRK